MSFKSDLTGIIRLEFKRYGIECNADKMEVDELAARYCEMLKRHIAPVRRTVHLSNEIHGSLEKLTQTSASELLDTALEARDATFELRRLLSNGNDVTRFLSKRIKDAPETQRVHDKLLWDYGMYHFHLSKDTDSTGFVRRSDYLLFAIVTQDHVYFVDVRPHHDPKGLQWVHQDLLTIVHSNWPELISPHVMRGVQGTVLTDEQKKELRRKNVNHVPELGNQAVAPLGWGSTMAGSSMRCMYWAHKLLHEIRRHQSYFDAQPSDLLSALESIGVDTTAGAHFELVLLSDLDLVDSVKAHLRADHCYSKDLCNMGFAVVERTTRLPIVSTIVYVDAEGFSPSSTRTCKN